MRIRHIYSLLAPEQPTKYVSIIDIRTMKLHCRSVESEKEASFRFICRMCIYLAVFGIAVGDPAHGLAVWRRFDAKTLDLTKPLQALEHMYEYRTRHHCSMISNT